MKIVVFWNVTPYTLKDIHQHFGTKLISIYQIIGRLS